MATTLPAYGSPVARRVGGGRRYWDFSQFGGRFRTLAAGREELLAQHERRHQRGDLPAPVDGTNRGTQTSRWEPVSGHVYWGRHFEMTVITAVCFVASIANTRNVPGPNSSVPRGVERRPAAFQVVHDSLDAREISLGPPRARRHPPDDFTNGLAAGDRTDTARNVDFPAGVVRDLEARD